MQEPLNIAGSEWAIIVFVALVLILGTGRLPGAAKKLGKAVNEYNRAKNEVREQIRGATGPQNISGPVGTEREKLEAVAKTVGVDSGGKTDEELRRIISEKMNQKE